MKFKGFKFREVGERGEMLLMVAFEQNGAELLWAPRWDEVKDIVRHGLATELANEVRHWGKRSDIGREIYEFRRFFVEMAQVAEAMEWALPAGLEPGARDEKPR